MASVVHKGLTKALEQAWSRECSRGTGGWLVTVRAADPCEDWFGGRVVTVCHHGTAILAIARGTLFVTATSASDRDGVNSIVRMLTDYGSRVSIAGDMVDMVDDHAGAVAHAHRERPHALDGLHDGIRELVVCPGTGSLLDALCESLEWKGRIPSVSRNGTTWWGA